MITLVMVRFVTRDPHAGTLQLARMNVAFDQARRLGLVCRDRPNASEAVWWEIDFPTKKDVLAFFDGLREREAALASEDFAKAWYDSKAERSFLLSKGFDPDLRGH